MRKVFHIVCVVCLLLPVWAPGEAESLSAFGREVPRDAQVLDLSGLAVFETDEMTALLDQLSDVREVLVYDAAVSSGQAGELRERYPEVFFGFTFRFQDHVVRTDQTAFSTLHNNRAPRHTSEDFDFLRHCVRLEALDLGHNAIEDISFIEGLTELKVLIIALNEIRDISPLEKLTKLEYVEMFRNRVRDIGPLAGLTSLRDLNMGYNNVSDLTPLYGLDSLERLWIYQFNGYSAGPTPRQTLREIKAALPGCRVDGVSAGTGGDWRKHPHYDVIVDIFKNSVYKPFD